MGTGGGRRRRHARRRLWLAGLLAKLAPAPAAGACDGVKAPLAYLEPHSSPNGLVFWRGQLYVAQWGQYLSNRFGRRVVRVDPRTGRSRVFADGFEHPLTVAVAVAPGGRALLVADWGRGTIHRIRRR